MVKSLVSVVVKSLVLGSGQLCVLNGQVCGLYGQEFGFGSGQEFGSR